MLMVFVQLNQLNHKKNSLSRKKMKKMKKNEDYISGRRMLIWAPGKCVKLYSLSFPHAHSGIMESLAVPDRMEILPFHWLTNRLTAAKPCPLPSSAYRDAPWISASSKE